MESKTIAISPHQRYQKFLAFTKGPWWASTTLWIKLDLFLLGVVFFDGAKKDCGKMGVPPKNNRELKNEGGWKMIFLFNLVIFRCVPRIAEDHFLYNFAPYFFPTVFASEDLGQKEGEIWDPKLVEVPNLTLTYLKQGIERNGEAWGDQNMQHKELRPETSLKTHQKGAAQCNCLSFEYHVYIYILYLDIYNISCIYI